MDKLNFNIENKNIIEKSNRYSYYDFTDVQIKNVISKDIYDVSNKEWRMLIQMIYPENMIGSGLFQPILIFEIKKNGERKDPPIAAYNGIDDIKRDLIKADCLLFRIMNYIEENSNFSFHESWKICKEKILKELED